MANPVCLSPLKFYDSSEKQCYHKTYAFGHISPLIVKMQSLPPFQFVIPNDLYDSGGELGFAFLVDINTGEYASENLVDKLYETGFVIEEYEGYKVAIYPGNLPIQIEKEGRYYLHLSSIHGSWNNSNWVYYSEVFCFTNSVNDCLEIEYWNETGNFYIKNGIVAFPNNFHFKLLLKSEIGKPEYSFEEEGTKRFGYNFIESQVSKKTYRFNTVIPEFICDAMRLIRLCDNKIIRSKGDEYEALTFEMDTQWETQGDLASVTCEFETDNIIANLGGFKFDKYAGGDFNKDYNVDFNNQ